MTREQRLRKHWRCYQHYSGLARLASQHALREADDKAPGWGGRWVYWMNVHATAAGIARDDRRRYGVLLKWMQDNV